MLTIRRILRFRPRFLGLVLGGLLVVGCGALRRPDVPVDRTQDPRIQREVEQRLAQEPSLEEGSIRVEVRGATVLLHGSVRGIGAWRCALKNAELVDGVRSVVDYLLLERGPRDVVCLAPPTGELVAGS